MDYGMIGLCVIAVLLVGALLWMGKSLIAAKAQLKLEEGRRADQNALNEANQKTLDAQCGALKSEFGKLAAALLGETQQRLAKANTDSVAALFGQLKERLNKYEEEVANAAKENSSLGTKMGEQLKSLQQFATEAQRFTAALVGGNKIQGNQGEAILAGIFEKSGFVRGTHYDMQQGTPADGRPDASIYDAMNKRIILIDAKMNIKDYIDAYNLPDDEAHRAEKSRAIKAHVASIKRQIDSLSRKRYAEEVSPTREGYTNLPLVAMFCPFNAVLEAALNEDPELMQYAFNRNIVLVTPLTLWGYLRLIFWGWKQQAIESKYEDIKKLGGEVLSALDAALNDLSSMGAALENARKAYDGLNNRMTTDKGQPSISRVARKLIDYGVVPVKKSKQLDKIVASMDSEGE